MNDYYLPQVITANQRDEQLLFATSNYCQSTGWTVTICNKQLLSIKGMDSCFFPQVITDCNREKQLLFATNGDE